MIKKQMRRRSSRKYWHLLNLLFFGMEIPAAFVISSSSFEPELKQGGGRYLRAVTLFLSLHLLLCSSVGGDEIR